MKRQKMVKIVSALIMVVVLLFFNIVPSAANPYVILDHYETIYTGSGYAVEAQVNQVLPESIMEQLCLASDALAQGYSVTELLGATPAYNCHSYAWYNRNPDTNTIWLNYPGRFKTDGYQNVTSDTWQAGDIIVYRGYEEEGGALVDIHSAVIMDVDSSWLGGVMVYSKWGACALFSGRGNEMPYDYTTYVVYRCSHLTYQYTGVNATYHARDCNYCHQSDSVAHHFTSHTSNNIYTHSSYCDECNTTYTVAHTLSSTNVCIVCGGKGISASINSQNLIYEEK